jgi:multiple sugar transport system ATP-binding protein
MNLVPGEIASGTLRFAGLEVPLPRPLPDRSVIAGVRPTDLPLADAGTDPGLPRLAATLDVVERLGAESHVIFEVDAPRLAGEAALAADETIAEGDETLLAGDRRARFTARIDGRRRLSPGERVELAVDPAAVHVFDPESGAALK